MFKQILNLFGFDFEISSYRNPMDYLWIGLMFLGVMYLGWNFNFVPIDMFNPFGVLHYWVLDYVMTYCILMGYTLLFWTVARFFTTVSSKYFMEQMMENSMVFCVLSFYQTAFNWGAEMGLTKLTLGHTDALSLIRDGLVHIFLFELFWYTLHRYMHDNKFLWKLGHEYHHQWNKPDMLIGITNFSVDLIVEPIILMVSANAPYFLFPCNYYLGKLIDLAYMILAVFVHFDKFPFKYHVNHHYLVNKNFGSHIPIFDLLFDTYGYRRTAITGRK